MSKLIEQTPPAKCTRLETSRDDLRGIEKDDLVRMLFMLHLVREFENAVLDLHDAGLVHGPAHCSIGQEAIGAASVMALRKTDMIGSTHRAHGHFLAKAFAYHSPDRYQPLKDPVSGKMQEVINKTLAEIMGLQRGWCKGRGGSMHLLDLKSGNLGSNAIVGGGIPLATGVAWAERLRDKDTVVVSFFGDGAINQGCFHEVANMAALWSVPVIYFIENNGYAVATPSTESSYVSDLGLRSLSHGINSMIVDGMDPVAVFLAVKQTVEKVRNAPFPFLIEAKTYRFHHHAGRLPGSAYGYRSKEEEDDWLARDPIKGFSKALIHEGIVDDRNLETLHEKAKASVDEAVAFSTERKEGKLYIPVENWPPSESLTEDLRCEKDLFSGVDFVEREDFSGLRSISYVEAIAAATLRSMERDKRVILLGEEVANLKGGAYQATKGIKEIFPERIINTPISECGFLGMAGGASSAGLRPIVEIMFPDFALVAADQLFNQIGKLRYMYGGGISFSLVVRTRVAIGYGYGGQHSLNPAGLFGLFSGWRVIAPSNAFDYLGLFNTAMRFDDPVLIIEHGKLYDEQGQMPNDSIDYYVQYGKAKVVRSGSDVTVLTYLTGVRDCLEAADALVEEGISAEVIDLRTLDYSGIDYLTVGESVKRTGSVLIVEQTPRSLALGARISDEIQERFFDYLDCPVGKVAAPDVPPPVSKVLEDAMLPSTVEITLKMKQAGKHYS